jgi:hypothetical protein
MKTLATCLSLLLNIATAVMFFGGLFLLNTSKPQPCPECVPQCPAPVPPIPVPDRFNRPAWLSQELAEQMQGVDLGEVCPKQVKVVSVLGHEWCADDRLHVYARVHSTQAVAGMPRNAGDIVDGVVHFRYRRLDLRLGDHKRTRYVFCSATLDEARTWKSGPFARMIEEAD